MNATGCTPNGADYTCACEDGWDGQNCDDLVSACTVLDPCVNATACNDVGQTYECVCEGGWDGPDCDVELNGCDADPCQNGGQCTSVGQGEYECDCSGLAYAGKDCAFPRFQILPFAGKELFVTPAGDVVYAIGDSGSEYSGKAIRWTEATGVEVLWDHDDVLFFDSETAFYVEGEGFFDDGFSTPTPVVPNWVDVVSGDGASLFGVDDEDRPWRWTAAGGAQYLFDAQVKLEAASRDGLHLVGEISFDGEVPPPPIEDGRTQGFHFDLTNQQLTMVGVPGWDDPDSGSSELVGISDDGNVLIGEGSAGGFVIRDGVVTMMLPHPTEGVDADTDAISGNGEVVVGSYEELNGGFVWDNTNGTRQLETLLLQQGVDVSDWQDMAGRALSYDGKVIVARFQDAENNDGSFRLALD